MAELILVHVTFTVKPSCTFFMSNTHHITSMTICRPIFVVIAGPAGDPRYWIDTNHVNLEGALSDTQTLAGGVAEACPERGEPAERRPWPTDAPTPAEGDAS